MVSGPQRHPSRDAPEQTFINVGDKGAVDFPGHGRYTPEDISTATSYYKAEPGSPEGRHILEPSQGALFNGDQWERAQAVKLGRKRFATSSYDTETVMASAMSKSTIPTSHLQSRRTPSGRDVPETHLITQGEDTSGYNWTGVGGYYSGPSTSQKADTVALRSGGAFVHELGHRKHLGTTPAWDESITHPRQINPDPLKEGVADAYEDRYGGKESHQVRRMSRDIEESGRKFESYQDTGYSTDPHAAKQRGWNDTDRAVYAATRAHASETGEQAHYIPRGRDVREDPGMANFGGGHPTTDATLHNLLSTSPHAAQALRQTGLKDVGQDAFRRHRDRQLLSQGQFVQGSMFHELRGLRTGKVYGYTENMEATPDRGWQHDEKVLDAKDVVANRLEAQHGEGIFPHHMNRNQFGEEPRTTGDVSHSLGVSRQHAKTAGFDSR